MGCDIHWVVEQKYEDRWIGIATGECSVRVPIDGKTSTIGQYRYAYSDRNYEFFGRLAGVRTDGPEPLGLPNDFSDLSKMVLDDDFDLHSASHLPLQEFHNRWLQSTNASAEVVKAIIKGEGKKDPYSPFWYPEDDQLFRVVFAFDN